MIYDATLKKLFQQPPNRLLSYALGKNVVVARILPTDLITVENLHPDQLFETEEGELIHAELHGYAMEEFAVRSLLYAGLVLRDYKRWPEQIVFWTGPRNVAIPGGLKFRLLDYGYDVIDLREVDGEFLLEGGPVEEAIFAVLCRLRGQRESVAAILRRIAGEPLERQREAIAQLLILSGLRGLKSLVAEEVKSMPVSFDIHENEFLEGIWQEAHQEGRQEGRQEGSLSSMRRVLLKLLENKFGFVPTETRSRVESADLARLDLWTDRVMRGSTIDEIIA